ncbi:MAG: gliding motility protein GldC [Bacteroidetes bacterium]|nr:gliding motility protein GldC [Bacteroidota bacterium]
MHESEINFKISLDEERMPETIEWHAPDGGVNGLQEAKGLLLGIWDGAEKSALRIDLWTKKMMVDEMAEFFYQSLMGMADTYNRATRQTELSNELKSFAKAFYKKAMETIEAEQKA